MRKSLSHLLLIILLSGFFSACAHQPVPSSSAERQEIDCASLSYDCPDSAENKHYYDSDYDSDDDQSHDHEYDDQSEFASSFGAAIFRGVVEGIVHGLILGIFNH